ncbi:multidrug/hemolysin transport system permease protein [Anaerotaenia torta]|uniref:ABC transporter permease n=1 Tax=Anaerotaenia torta TaxID=433293 RepID=UPI003D24390A
MLIFRLIKRNILVYSRDRSNIFYSLLSMLIIIGLMVVFLGKMNADNVVDLLQRYGGERNIDADRVNAEQLVVLSTLAGIVMVNSITITLSLVGIMVEDEAHKKLSSFYVTPVNRGVFVLSYVLAAIIMGVIMCTLTLALGEAYIVLSGGSLLPAAALGEAFLHILLNVFTSASMVFLIANFVHSQSAFGGLSTITGTLVGFLAGIYLPMGMLPEKVQTILKCLPLLHGCSIMRRVFTGAILDKTFAGCPEELITGYKEYMGITVVLGGEVLSATFQMAFLLISGIIFISIAGILQRKRNVMSR